MSTTINAVSIKNALRAAVVATLTAVTMITPALAKGGASNTVASNNNQSRHGAWELERVGAWTVGFSRNRDESYCFARADYEDGPRVYVSLAHGGVEAYVHVFNEAWGPQADGERGVVLLRFDSVSEPMRHAAWTVGGDSAPGIRVALTEDALLALLSSSEMRINTVNGDHIGAFELGRLASAMSAVGRCLQNNAPQL